MNQYKVEIIVPYFLDVDDDVTEEQVIAMGENFAQEALNFAPTSFPKAVHGNKSYGVVSYFEVRAELVR